MTLRAWRRLFVVGVVVVVVQVGVLERIVIGGAHPDGFLMFAIAAGIVGGAQRGAVVGFVTGLVADVFVTTPYGLSALCYVLVAFTVGLMASLPGGRGPRLYQVLVSFVAGFLGSLLFAGLLVLLDQPRMPLGELLVIATVVAVSNVVLALPTSAAMQWALGAAASPRDVVSLAGSPIR